MSLLTDEAAMSLQQLVDYFNDRFEREHQSNFRPFILENDWVSGIFGPIRVSSVFAPVHHAANHEQLIGHIAQISVTPYDSSVYNDQSVAIGNVMTDIVAQPTNFQSIISLDRLSRTVHMLNYLNHAHAGGVVFLDVDPRHILSIQQDHGAYFEKIIFECGLATESVVISTTINSAYALNHTQLLNGLYNYRRHGYQIALNIGSLYAATGLWDLVVKLSANFLRINAPNLESSRNLNVIWPAVFKPLIELHRLKGGQTVLQQVGKKAQADIAASSGFELVQGSYYENLINEQSLMTTEST